MNGLFYPSLFKCINPSSFKSLSLIERDSIIRDAPKLALYNVIFIRLISCIVCCSLFSYYAPNAIDNQYIIMFQIIIMLQFEVGDFLNQKAMPHPDWYNNYGLGILPWMLSI